MNRMPKRRTPHRSAWRPSGSPLLTFTPTAWAKLIYLRDRGDTEVGGFAIAEDPEHPLHVTDVQLIRQNCTSVTVAFEDEAVADFVDRQVDAGLTLAQCMRIWVHTHPGDSALPSATDEDTFKRVFGGCDWAVMFILAEGGETYARLRFNAGPGGEIEIPVTVDFSEEFYGSDWDAWEAEYEANVNALLQTERFWTAEPSPQLGLDPLDEQLRQTWLEDWSEYARQHDEEEVYGYEA